MSPNPRFGIRKRNRESKDTHVDTLTRSPGDGSISPTSSSTSTEPRKTAENNHCLELRSGTSPVTEAQDTEPENGIEERQDSRYVTLTITGSSGTYVTLVELGDTTIATSYPISQTTAYLSPCSPLVIFIKARNSDKSPGDHAYQTLGFPQEQSSVSS